VGSQSGAQARRNKAKVPFPRTGVAKLAFAAAGASFEQRLPSLRDLLRPY
jgi:hypothetical protein